MSSHRFLSRWLIRPVLHWLIRHRRYPKYGWYDRMFRAEFAHYDPRDEIDYFNFRFDIEPEEVEAFRRWWGKRGQK